MNRCHNSASVLQLRSIFDDTSSDENAVIPGQLKAEPGIQKSPIAGSRVQAKGLPRDDNGVSSSIEMCNDSELIKQLHAKMNLLALQVRHFDQAIYMLSASTNEIALDIETDMDGSISPDVRREFYHTGFRLFNVKEVLPEKDDDLFGGYFCSTILGISQILLGTVIPIVGPALIGMGIGDLFIL